MCLWNQIKWLNVLFSKQSSKICVVWIRSIWMYILPTFLIWYSIYSIHTVSQHNITFISQSIFLLPLDHGPHLGLWPEPHCATDLNLVQYVLNPGQKVVPLLVLPVHLQLDRPPSVVTHLTVLLCTQLEKENIHKFLKLILELHLIQLSAWTDSSNNTWEKNSQEVILARFPIQFIFSYYS